MQARKIASPGAFPKQVEKIMIVVFRISCLYVQQLLYTFLQHILISDPAL
jgi:hypothetical protein